MASGPNHAVLEDLRTLFDAGTATALTNRQLLDRFVSDQEGQAELAFAALVHRHGPMVFRVCREVLRDSHAAEDAFQATFLVLARRIRSIRRPDSLGAWLHGVAFRVAASSRSAAARRRRHESKRAEAVQESLPIDSYDIELAPMIHEEVARLPEKHRVAVVLCYLQGLTSEQAADQLGWPVGTLHSRLAWARERLKGRLARRGMTPSALVLAMRGPIECAVPTALKSMTVNAALYSASVTLSANIAALTNDLLRNTLMTKIKLVAIGLTTAGFMAVVGTGLARGRQASDKPETTVKSLTAAESLVGQLSATAGHDLEPRQVRASAAESSQILHVRLQQALNHRARTEVHLKQGVISTSEAELARFDVSLIAAQIETQRDGLRDELELLQAQLAIHQADVTVTQRLAAGQAGAIERIALLPLKQAELHAVEVRIKQVERRLKAFEPLVQLVQRSTAPTANAQPTPPPGRAR